MVKRSVVGVQGGSREFHLGAKARKEERGDESKIVVRP